MATSPLRQHSNSPAPATSSTRTTATSIISSSSSSSSSGTSTTNLPASSTLVPSSSAASSPYAGPHVVLSLPRCSWRKGDVSEYVSKARVFYDSLHESITLFTGSPVNKAWTSDRSTGTWQQFPVNLPPQNDILGAQLSPDKSMIAIRVSDKEVKVVSTATGEVLTARSCRPPTRMISVHWLSTELTLLFITNAGIELYSLIRGKLKHVKTAPYNIVYHWVLLSDSLLLLVDNKSVFQLFHMNHKTLSKVCRFELDVRGTSQRPTVDATQPFHRDQVVMLNVYGRMVVCFVNEAKAQLHLLSLGPSSDEMEQTHVYDLYQPGRYDISCVDDVIVAHQASERLSLLFDVRTDAKTAVTEPLAIGSPLSEDRRVSFYVPDEEYALPSQQENFTPYRKWTFLSPCYVWESIGDQQQGHFHTLALNNEATALSWPVGRRAKLVDYLMKRSTADAKLVVLQLMLQLVCEDRTQLALLSRMFSMMQRIHYDHRMHDKNISTPSLQSSSSFSSPRQPSTGFPLPSPRSSTSPLRTGTRKRSETASSMSSAGSTSSNNGALWDLDGDVVLESERMDIEDPSSSSLSSSSLVVEQNINGYMLISQADVFTHVFLPARRHLPPAAVIPAVVEYLRSIHRHYLRVEDYINDLLVSLLLADKQYFQLHQFLQYHLLIDSLPIANRLIDTATTYLPALQLGLDMLHRLNANNRLVQVLLQRNQPLSALHLVTHKSPLFDRPGLQVRDWLRSAKAHGDPYVFFTVFRWMEARNLTLRNTNVFYTADKCDEYVLHYVALFGPQHRLNPPASHKEAVLSEENRPAWGGEWAGLGVEEVRRRYRECEGDDWDELDESDWQEHENVIRLMVEAVSAQQAAAAADGQKASEEASNGELALAAPRMEDGGQQLNEEVVDTHDDGEEEDEEEVDGDEEEDGEEVEADADNHQDEAEVEEPATAVDEHDEDHDEFEQVAVVAQPAAHPRMEIATNRLMSPSPDIEASPTPTQGDDEDEDETEVEEEDEGDEEEEEEEDAEAEALTPPADSPHPGDQVSDGENDLEGADGRVPVDGSRHSMPTSRRGEPANISDSHVALVQQQNQHDDGDEVEVEDDEEEEERGDEEATPVSSLTKSSTPSAASNGITVSSSAFSSSNTSKQRLATDRTQQRSRGGAAAGKRR